jgi:nitrate reductase delta subunit
MTLYAIDPSVRSGAYLAISRLLSYPDADLVQDEPLLRLFSEQLPPEPRNELHLFLDNLRDKQLLQLQQEYVAAFDLKRRCCLYLSYYLNGDTRRRGMALWRFQETYRMAGYTAASGELPDYLPVLLEFAAGGSNEEQAALALLDEHLEGITVLQAALAKFGVAHQHVVGALLAMLPKLSPEQLAAAHTLIASGPPTETVGLEPFGQELLTIGARP